MAAGTIQINGNAAEIKAEVFLDGVFNRALTLNTSQAVDSGGFDPIFGTTTSPEEVRVSGINGYTLTGDGLPASIFDPINATTRDGWTNEGDYYSYTVIAGSNGTYTPETYMAPPEAFLNIIFEGDADKYSVEIQDGVGATLAVLATDIELNISNTNIGNYLVLIPNVDCEITSETNNFPFDPLTGEALNFQSQLDGTFKVLLEDYHFNDHTPAYVSTVEAITSSNVVTPFNQVFNLSDENLLALAEVPMSDPNEPDVNKSDYIINLLYLPFELPAALIGDSTDIMLGSYDTNILAETLISDSLTIELGSIAVPEVGNSFDYVSKYELLLPFVQTVYELNAYEVVGRTLSVQYILDVYTGDITINVYNGVNSEPIISDKNSIGRNIPYRMINSVVQDLGGLNGVENSLKSATLKITTPELVLGEFNNLVSIVGSIGSKKGFIKFDEVKLNIKANLAAKNAIKSALQNGVIVK